MLHKPLIGLSIFLITALASFRTEQNPATKIQESYLSNLQVIKQEAQGLLQTVKNNEQSAVSYRKLRDIFKQTEFLLAQLDYESYLKKWNGAPLPKLEKNVPDLKILAPHGLQVIDELIIEDSEENREPIQKELEMLIHSSDEALLLHKNVTFSNEILLHAIQNQLLRIYTLGITGFDTPGSLQGLEDAIQSLTGIKYFISLSGLAKTEKFTASVTRNMEYIRLNIDFENFDRLAYYKEYWQPMYEQLIMLYSINDVSTWEELNPKVTEVNSSSKHLFSNDFFNLQAFLDFTEQKLTPKTIELGKKMFYDPILSSNGKMSCSSCHNPKLGFSDGQAKSIALDQTTTLDRNAPGLVNAVYTKAYFYDVRATHLSQQFEHVIFSKNEFNTTLVDIFSRLADSEEYAVLFRDAFPEHGSNPVNPYTFKVSLAAYVASLRAFNSSFDRFVRGESDTLSEQVKKGYNLFMGKAACATCHFPPTFSGLVPPYYDDTETEVLGVPSTPEYDSMDPDPGRYSIKRPKERADFYKHSFKTATVRNTSLTAPYMHNGVFANLDEVLEFYNNGGGAGHGLDVPHQTLASDSLGLSDQELFFLKSFMHALEENVD